LLRYVGTYRYNKNIFFTQLLKCFCHDIILSLLSINDLKNIYIIQVIEKMIKNKTSEIEVDMVFFLFFFSKYFRVWFYKFYPSSIRRHTTCIGTTYCLFFFNQQLIIIYYLLFTILYHIFIIIKHKQSNQLSQRS